MPPPGPLPRVKPLYPVLVLLAASALWGLTWLPLKYFAGLGFRGVNVTLVGHGSVGALSVPWLALRFRAWRGERRSMALLGLFGGLACFRDNKTAYLGVQSKADLFRIWGTMTEFVRETYVCPEFARRQPGAGYRG